MAQIPIAMEGMETLLRRALSRYIPQGCQSNQHLQVYQHATSTAPMA